MQTPVSIPAPVPVPEPAPTLDLNAEFPSLSGSSSKPYSSGDGDDVMGWKHGLGGGRSGDTDSTLIPASAHRSSAEATPINDEEPWWDDSEEDGGNEGDTSATDTADEPRAADEVLPPTVYKHVALCILIKMPFATTAQPTNIATSGVVMAKVSAQREVEAAHKASMVRKNTQIPNNHSFLHQNHICLAGCSGREAGARACCRGQRALCRARAAISGPTRKHTRIPVEYFHISMGCA